MKYRFIAEIHNLLLERSDLSIKLPQGVISNSPKVLQECFDNDLSIGTIGVHCIDEFLGSTFFYVDGIFPDNYTQSDIDKFGTALTYAYLRVIQSFVADLWRIRDNSIYVRDGFLYAYHEMIEDGTTFKASISSVITKADGSKENTIFTNQEIALLSDGMFCISDEASKGNFLEDYKNVTQSFMLKSNRLSRKELAFVYIRLARDMGVVALKLLFYSIALEALVGTANTELSHRMAERVVALVGGTPEEKVRMYGKIKRAYDIRSTVAHGDALKSDSDLVDQSVFVDECLRKMMALDQPYELKKDQIDQFFLEKLMGENSDCISLGEGEN